MDYSLKCFDETYNKYVVFSYIGILYPVLFPTIFVLILYFFHRRPRMAMEMKKHEASNKSSLSYYLWKLLPF